MNIFKNYLIKRLVGIYFGLPQCIRSNNTKKHHHVVWALHGGVIICKVSAVIYILKVFPVVRRGVVYVF